MEKLFVFYILLSYFSSHQGNPFSSLVLGGILTHFHLLIIFTYFNICAHSAAFDREPTSPRQESHCNEMGRKGRQGSHFFQDPGSGTWPTSECVQAQAKEPFGPHHLIWKSSLSQFLSHFVVSLPQSINWEMHTFTLLFHHVSSGPSARLQASYRKVSVEPPHPQLPEQCVAYNRCSINASWMLIHETAGPKMPDIKS